MFCTLNVHFQQRKSVVVLSMVLKGPTPCIATLRCADRGDFRNTDSASADFNTVTI